MTPHPGSPIDRLPTRPADPGEPEGWEADCVPRVLPVGWTLHTRTDDGAMFLHHSGLSAIMSAAREQDGKRWIHLSIARRSRLPSWEELVAARNVFIGPEKLVVQVLAPAGRHISIHRYCLHLWHCLDGDPVPDFARGGDSL